jgi:hypothetical protein
MTLPGSARVPAVKLATDSIQVSAASGRTGDLTTMKTIGLASFTLTPFRDR